MKRLGVMDAAAYKELLSRSRTEWDELVEAVVVTETWFFRDPEAFGVVVDAARACRPGSTLRVLAVPCSSGEEPYSLAIALKDAGVSAERILIEAMDISARALARARTGIYGKNSFRGKDLGYRERYFQSNKNGFVLHSEIRDSVTFVEGNLLNSDFAPGHKNYDFIFCRNLLIYFDRPTQRKALAKLDALLAPHGILFVGAAEQPLALEFGLVSANFAKAFGCRKAKGQGMSRFPSLLPFPQGEVAHGESSLRRRRDEWAKPSEFPVAFSGAVREVNSAQFNGARSERPEESQIGSELANARELADAGRLQDAAEICERYLGNDSDSAQGWYLLGLIKDASGDSRAVECYRKALYLKPDHYESLLQMALWLEESGERERARTYKARAERAKRQKTDANAQIRKA
jgi:chemotaxis protein methyltransferase WspC